MTERMKLSALRENDLITVFTPHFLIRGVVKIHSFVAQVDEGDEPVEWEDKLAFKSLRGDVVFELSKLDEDGRDWSHNGMAFEEVAKPAEAKPSDSERKHIVWRELKDFCNALPEDQLGNTVIAWDEETVERFSSAEQLAENYYVDDEGCTAESDMISSGDYELREGKLIRIDGNNEEFEPEIAYKKGTPILNIYF